jgi:hypothetical protein
MLGVLISQKNKPRINATELLEASEKALEWTRQEERNLAMARVLNSPK